MDDPRMFSSRLPGAMDMNLVFVRAWIDGAERHLLHRKLERAFSDGNAALGHLFLAAAKLKTARLVIDQIEAEGARE